MGKSTDILRKGVYGMLFRYLKNFFTIIVIISILPFEAYCLESALISGEYIFIEDDVGNSNFNLLGQGLYPFFMIIKKVMYYGDIKT